MRNTLIIKYHPRSSSGGVLPDGVKKDKRKVPLYKKILHTSGIKTLTNEIIGYNFVSSVAVKSNTTETLKNIKSYNRAIEIVNSRNVTNIASAVWHDDTFHTWKIHVELKPKQTKLENSDKYGNPIKVLGKTKKKRRTKKHPFIVDVKSQRDIHFLKKEKNYILHQTFNKIWTK